jgi:hypothetical protein
MGMLRTLVRAADAEVRAFPITVLHGLVATLKAPGLPMFLAKWIPWLFAGATVFFKLTGVWRKREAELSEFYGHDRGGTKYKREFLFFRRN